MLNTFDYYDEEKEGDLKKQAYRKTYTAKESGTPEQITTPEKLSIPQGNNTPEQTRTPEYRMSNAIVAEMLLITLLKDTKERGGSYFKFSPFDSLVVDNVTGKALDTENKISYVFSDGILIDIEYESNNENLESVVRKYANQLGFSVVKSILEKNQIKYLDNEEFEFIVVNKFPLNFN